jgi:hypothetical protein
VRLTLPDDDPRKKNPYWGIDMPRPAVVAGVAGFVLAQFVLGHAALGDKYKSVGTMVMVISFAVPFVVVRYLVRRRRVSK